MSSTKYIQQVIKSFLETDDNEVICMKGRWGVGKTYFWNSVVKDKENQKKKPRYSYVSLFGINSLQELKLALFQNAVPVSNIGEPLSLDNVKKNISQYSEQMGRKGSKWLASYFLSHDIDLLAALSYLGLFNSIICIDDVERRGDGLNIKDILGLVSELKERKNCKIMIIMNSDSALIDPYKHELEKFYEKVIDETLVWEPSPREACEIALSDAESVKNHIIEFCALLQLSNIRVIRKIYRIFLRLEPHLKSLDSKITYQTIHSLTLFVASIYGRGDSEFVPSIEFIINQRSMSRLGLGGEKLTEQEKGWNNLLDAYKFYHVDEYDEALLTCVQHSRFELHHIQAAIEGLSKRLASEEADKKLNHVWSLYHDHFDNNESEIIEAIDVATQDLSHLTPGNLNSVVDLLKSLGCPAKAKALIERYIQERSSTPEIFDLRKNLFQDKITDLDLRAAFDAKASINTDRRAPVDVLIKIAGDRGWNPEDISLLSALSPDDYYSLFKKNNGPNLSRIVAAALKFSTFQDADSQMLQIAQSAKDALKKIASESALNRLRIKSKYGFQD